MFVAKLLGFAACIQRSHGCNLSECWHWQNRFCQ